MSTFCKELKGTNICARCVSVRSDRFSVRGPICSVQRLTSRNPRLQSTALLVILCDNGVFQSQVVPGQTAACLVANLTLKIELIAAIPAKKITSARWSPLVSFPS